MSDGAEFQKGWCEADLRIALCTFAFVAARQAGERLKRRIVASLERAAGSVHQSPQVRLAAELALKSPVIRDDLRQRVRADIRSLGSLPPQ